MEELRMSNFYKEETKSIQKMDSSDEDESETAGGAAEVLQPAAKNTKESSVKQEILEDTAAVGLFRRHLFWSIW